MLQNKFFYLLITFLWLTGGFCVLLSLLYMGQYRRRNWWNIGNTVSVPRILGPLYGSLLLFCTGLALHAFTVSLTPARWIAAGWALLATLFALRGSGVLVQALDEGWDTPLVADPGDNMLANRLITTVTAISLLANGVLLGRWGIGQFEAGRLDTSFFWRDERISVATALPTIVPASAIDRIAQSGGATASRAATIVTIVPKNIAAQANVGGTLAPAIVTVAPAGIKITPTPLALSARTGLAINERPIAGTPTEAATLTHTLLITVTVTPADSSAAAKAAFVPPAVTVRSARGANLRRGPSTRNRIIITLANNRRAVALGRSTGGDWLQIQLADGTVGWIYTPLTSLAGTVETLPVIE